MKNQLRICARRHIKCFTQSFSKITMEISVDYFGHPGHLDNTTLANDIGFSQCYCKLQVV